MSDAIFVPLRERNDNASVLCESNANPAVLAIILAGIKRGEHWTIEDFRGIEEIEAMLAEIFFALSLIPFKLHETNCSYEM